MKVLGLVVLAACGLVQTQSTSSTPARAGGGGTRDEVVVPETARLTIEQATARLHDAGFTQIAMNGHGTYSCGTTPGAGHTTLAHLSIELTACDRGDDEDDLGGSSPPAQRAPTGPTGPVATPGADGMLVVPNLLGLTLEQATAAVARAGFRQPLEDGHNIPCAPSAHVAEDTVKCQAPHAGEHVRPNMLVQVLIFKVRHRKPGERPTADELAGCVGMTRAAAETYLRSLGITVKIEFSDPMPGEHCKPGRVCSVEAWLHEQDPVIVYLMPAD